MNSTGYVSLFNETDGTYTNLIIDNANINSANIVNATITTENVITSTINNLTIGNFLRFPDGSVSLPSIAFANETSSGFYRVGTNQIGLVTNGVLRALITNTGLVSVFDVQTGGQFLCNSSSVSAPSFSFVGDPDTGLYESAANELSISAGNNQVMKFNNSLITALRNLFVHHLI